MLFRSLHVPRGGIGQLYARAAEFNAVNEVQVLLQDHERRLEQQRGAVFQVDQRQQFDQEELAVAPALLLATAAIVGTILFSLIAYVLVKTTLPGRAILDAICWLPAAIPGVLLGLGLLWMFLGTPVFRWLYGTLPLLSIAAIVGDAVNYAIGRMVGPRVFRAESTQGFWGRALNREHLDRAHEFFERFGGKAIIMGRFAPIIRTFVPFVAGAGAMTYSKFTFFNVAGGIAWVGICTGAGYAFGNVPIVKNNFSLVALGIVAVSLLPMVVELWRSRTRTGPA